MKEKGNSDIIEDLNIVKNWVVVFDFIGEGAANDDDIDELSIGKIGKGIKV